MELEFSQGFLNDMCTLRHICDSEQTNRVNVSFNQDGMQMDIDICFRAHNIDAREQGAI